MGYDQYLRFEIYKEDCEAETLKIALGLAFPAFMGYLKDYGGLCVNKEGIHFDSDGRHMWDGGLIFEEFSPQEISEKLGCTISIYYEGEEKEDAESMKFVDGEKIAHKVLQWVDVMKRE